jgi:hypothetical protein
MTQNRVDILDPSGLNLGCFVFGTPSATLDGGTPPFGGPCFFALNVPGASDGAFLFTTNGGLPSAPGIYARDFIGVFETPTSSEVIGGPPSLVPGIDTGTMSLDVSLTSTPEPASVFLMAIAVSVLCAVFRKRLRIPAPA